MPAQLTTHVLDLTLGRPAAGVKIELWRLGPAGERTLLKTAATNSDGRTSPPLLGPGEMAAGDHELVFFIGEYFERSAGKADRFFDRVPVRFSLADAQSSVHVPLLVTPWAYSTYRGS